MMTIMKWLWHFLFIYYLLPLQAEANKNKCRLTELSLKNCPLNLYGYRMHFLDDKVLIYDGVWRTIEKLPLIGSATDWQDIIVKKIGQKVFVQFYIWTEPFGEAEVQNLKWFVYGLEQKKIKLLAEHIVQKRSRNFDKETESYIYDKLIPHKLIDKKGEAFMVFRNKEQKL